MSLFIVAIIGVGALALGLALAYLPMRLLLTQMAKNITAPIRDLIQRQRERRAIARQTAERRKAM
jgi:hypothetical protein